MGQIFHYIDDEILFQYKWNHKRTLQRFMSMTYLKLKYNTDNFTIKETFDTEQNLPAISINDCIIDN